ncbi:SMP-30/gluconolactonase/LRE family protein [Chitinophaga agrisoli]|uniref:SMP-30/gluconolactonase/LRE family protein n=1 Tax=Chitinophaga agrisoli TaxID=2607653 RepID=A0A5B2VMG6_9BACT|nr:SMP-30/gluconolactonase/LRE family protein [Chitinophaga agrisoli]KAA2239369.1 SMP-30/gluconolactonase/LRE family protein [Chitinophaga agrisoli]
MDKRVYLKRYLFSLVFLLITSGIAAQSSVKVITTHTEKDVIPEGITLDPASGTIYVSSIALQKILAINKDGSHKDLISSGQDGFREGLGMKIDAKKQWLWVVSNQKQENRFISCVHAFDIKTGAVKQKYVTEDTARHLFNDLILHPNGRIYITDTYAAALYEVDPVKQKLDMFLRDSLITFPNGITYNEKGKVYIATYSHGLMQLDLPSKKLMPLKGYADSTKAYNLDGLAYWNHHIIGVYNGGATNKDNAIMQYSLNSGGDGIIKEQAIDIGNALFHDPTTAAVLGDKLYVLANSYLGEYNANKESTRGITDQLGPVVILVYPLK